MVKKILSTMGMIILLSLIIGSWNVASGDPVINYQGRLTDPNGNPINGVYKIVFKIYEQETGGSALWIENYNAVPVSNGFFSVKLGSITSLTLASVDFSGDLWLGITVESDSEMSPRLKLEDVPYALGSKGDFVAADEVKGSKLCIGTDCKISWPSGGGSSQWITNGSDIHYDAGNVGIGTANPKGKLGVSFNNDDELVIYSPGENRLAIQTTLDGQPLSTYGEGENRLLLQPIEGNVGIGTTNPEARFDVRNGNIILGETFDLDGVSNNYGSLKFRLYGMQLRSGKSGINGGDMLALDLAPYENSILEIVRTNYGPVAWIQANGNAAFGGAVNIGGTGYPGAGWTLRVQGNALAESWQVFSDSRFKKNIAHIDNALDTVLRLNGVSYEWNTEKHNDKNFSEGKHYGVIGQDTEKVLPEIVNEDGNGYKTVAYTDLIPILIESIKEQQKIIDELKAKVQKLESKDIVAKTQ